MNVVFITSNGNVSKALSHRCKNFDRASALAYRLRAHNAPFIGVIGNYFIMSDEKVKKMAISRGNFW